MILKKRKYLQISRKRFDPLALAISTTGLLAVFTSMGSLKGTGYFLDTRSILVVVGGTLASILFQFDFSSTFQTIFLVIKSFLGTPEKSIISTLEQLNNAIINDNNLEDLRSGDDINGELLNDIVYMKKNGLLYEEIDEFVTAKISDHYLERQTAVELLSTAATVAPALGLFGTVVGLIGVLKSLKDPSAIGQSMSLALMTTAYGAGLGSLVFTPLAGRIEHHNRIFLESHKQLLSKVSILLGREDRNLEKLNRTPGSIAA